MTDVLLEAWRILNESAVFILVGFGIAAGLHVYLTKGRAAQYLTDLSSRSVFLAALVGLPLPLCSCSVLPAAVALRKKGASKGATLSFLISTPETSVTSILLTYALLGPLMAVFRPIAAFVSAVAAGLADNLVERKLAQPEPDTTPTDAAEDTTFTGVLEGEQEKDDGPTLLQGLRFAFVEIFDDIIGWLLLGFVVAGVLNVLVPPSVMSVVFGGAWQSMLIMLVIGVPLYVCAEASTPIAAAFIAGGVNPGAALVFLLVGPATNIGSLGVLGKQLGRRTVTIYLIALSIVALLMGWVLNLILAGGGINLAERTLTEPLIPTSIKLLGALAFAVLSVLSFGRLRYLDRVLEWLDGRLPVRVNRRTSAVSLGIAAVLAYVGSGFRMVQPGQVGFVKRFGRVVRADLPPGAYYVSPYPFERMERLAVRAVRRLEMGYATETTPDMFAAVLNAGQPPDNPRESFLLLADENIANVKSVVHYGVKDGRAFDYLYGNSDVEALVRSVSLAALRQYLGTCVIDTILTTERAAAEQAIAELIQEHLDVCDTGIRCIGFRFLDLHAPPSVHGAFRDVASAMEDKEARINRAQAHQAKVLPLARGRAAGTLEQAQGYARRAVDEAIGRADRFLRRYREYVGAKDLTRRRLYFETMDSVLPRIRKYIKPPAKTGGELEIWFTKPQRTASPPFTQHDRQAREPAGNP